MTGGSSNTNTWWYFIVVYSTMTWDAEHWSIGWFPATLFAGIVFLFCMFLRIEKSRTRVILTMVAFVIGYWAYFVVYFLAFLLLFCLVCCLYYKDNQLHRRINRAVVLGNPMWRRRSWLVVMRARRRSPKGNWGRCLKWFVSRRSGMRDELVLPLTVRNTGGVVAFVPSGMVGDSFKQLVMKVVDLPEEEVFREIVSYL